MILTDRQALKKKLRWGDQTEIAKLADVEYQTVLAWFRGESNNATIERCAKALAAKRQKDLAEKLHAIES